MKTSLDFSLEETRRVFALAIARLLFSLAGCVFHEAGVRQEASICAHTLQHRLQKLAVLLKKSSSAPMLTTIGRTLIAVMSGGRFILWRPF